MTAQQLPEGWQMVRFGEIANHISKRVEPSETELDIYVGLEHLDPDSLKIKRYGMPSDVGGQKLLVKKGQIIFGKRRAYQRKVAVADWDCICSAHAMVLEANQDKVIPELLPFFMQSDIFMNRAIAISEGSLSPTIKWKILASQSFLFPKLEQQKRILDLCKASLLAVNESSKLNRVKVRLYELLSRELFENGIKREGSRKTAYGLVPLGWKLVNFGSLMIGGTQNGLYKGKEFYGKGFPMVHMGEMFSSASITELSDIENKVLLDATEMDKFGLLKNDLLFARRSLTPEGAGLCCIYKGSDRVVSFESSIIRVSLDEKKANSDFFNLYFRSKLGRWNMGKIIQTVAASGITGSDLKSILVPLPPVEEQKEIVNILSELKLEGFSSEAALRKIAKSQLNSEFEKPYV